MNNKIIVSIHDGQASVDGLSDDMSLELRNYDVALYSDDIELETDEDGNEYDLDFISVPTEFIFNSWSTADIRSYANDNNIELSEIDIKNIALKLQKEHDPNIGINWLVIDQTIESYMSDERSLHCIKCGERLRNGMCTNFCNNKETHRLCFQCNSPVSFEIHAMEANYPYYCPECDENKFEFEVVRVD